MGDNIETFKLCKRAAEEQIDLSKLEERERKIYIRNPSLAVRTKSKLTPLMLSIINNCEQIFYYLLKCDMDLNEQDEKGYTALHHAISVNDIHKARQLIQFGADTKIRTYKFLTPYDLATSKQLKRILDPKAELSDDSDEESKDTSYQNVVPNDEMKKKVKASINSNENQLIDKLNSIKDSQDKSHKFDYKTVRTNKSKPGSSFYSSIRSFLDKNDEKANPLSKMSNSVIYETKEENENDSINTRSRIMQTINNAPVKRINRELNGSAMAINRNGSLSVKRVLKSREGANSQAKPFYLPDIKGNYSEYVKDKESYAIPRSLKQFREYSKGLSESDNRFKTPLSKKNKIL